MWHPDFERFTVTRSPYRREPYVRVDCGAGPDDLRVDAKALAWTSEHVLINWQDDELVVHEAWVPADKLRRIERAESGWRDPYDLIG